jgi:beta-lactamase class D
VLLTYAGMASASPLEQAAVADEVPGRPRVEVDTESGALFREAKVDGAFVLLDVRRNVLKVVNAELSTKPFVPCSTFKIPNTLIGLETGVISGADFALKWDGKPRSIALWNRDHDLSSAMRDSVVWFYQEVARRIGAERMKEQVRKLAYGNQDTGTIVDRFWLDGPLRISPRQQVAFLRRLQSGALPVKPAHAALVRQLIVLEQQHGYTLRGKTGLGEQDGHAVSWLVGDVDVKGEPYVYAALLVDPSEDTGHLLPLRRSLPEKFLSRFGLAAPKSP